jgi:hypothetical protein
MEEAAANAGDQDGDGRYKFNTLVTMEIYYTTSIETILQMVDNQMNNIFARKKIKTKTICIFKAILDHM